MVQVSIPLGRGGGGGGVNGNMIIQVKEVENCEVIRSRKRHNVQKSNAIKNNKLMSHFYLVRGKVLILDKTNRSES